MKKYIFIMGCDRSGTTALVHLMNAHPKICIGMERYKRLVGTPHQLDPALFEREAFFSLHSDQTNIRWDHFYQLLTAKYDGAEYVGDKVPRYFHIIPQLRGRFPGATLIFLARDPYSVASSWKRRAMNPKDSNWPESHGVEQAVRVWNRSLAAFRDAAAISTDDLVFLRYEAVFGHDLHARSLLLQRLRLDDTTAVDMHFARTQADWTRKSKQPDNLTDQDRALIEKSANFELLNELSSGQACKGARPTERSLSAAVEVKNALIIPFESLRCGVSKSSPTPFVGAVLDAECKQVPAAILHRFGRSITSARKHHADQAVSRFKGRAFFGGYLFAHYGHFLTESISRLWAWRADEHPIIIFIGNISALCPWQRKVLDLLGVSAEIKVVTEPTRIDNLIVAEPGFEIGGAFLSKHNNFLSQISCNPTELKLWLSRSALGAEKGGVVGEADFEQVLSAHGWTVFHPEQHTIEEQLRAFSESTRIAGWEGSALHTLLLLKNCNAQIDIFVRRASASVGPQYQTIAEVKGLRQRIHNVPLEALTGKSRSTKYRVLDDQPLRDVLIPTPATNDSPETKTPVVLTATDTKRDPDWSPRRINALATALSAENYLEIGVNAGRTFRKIKIRKRDGVDPNFRFDTAMTSNEVTRLHPMTSDEFFMSGLAQPTYDIIFIDGLHIFEQAFRDFVSCLSVCHVRSVIVIDDTMPSDIFSALRDSKEAVRLRSRNGTPSKAWHGDVYKLIFAIHDFFPLLDFSTITGPGNPQTLVWKAKRRKMFQPKFDSLETISRLTYVDFLKHQGLMNTVAEAEGISDCVGALRPDAHSSPRSGAA